MSDDAYAVMYNPAGLIQMTKQQVALTHWIELEGISSQFLSYGYPFSIDQTYAVSLIYRQVPLIQNIFTEESVQVYDLVFGFSGAFRLEDLYPGLSLGITLKGVHAVLGPHKALAPALDMGVLVRELPFHSKVALVIQNVGPAITFINSGDPLPLGFRLAASSVTFQDKQKEFLLALDLAQSIDHLPKIKMGAEFTYADFLAFRGGYVLDLGASVRGLALGLGGKVTLEGIRYAIDYAYQPFYWKESNNPTHILSLSAVF